MVFTKDRSCVAYLIVGYELRKLIGEFFGKR